MAEAPPLEDAEGLTLHPMLREVTEPVKYQNSPEPGDKFESDLPPTQEIPEHLNYVAEEETIPAGGVAAVDQSNVQPKIGVKMRGFCKWFDNKLGYGFIESRDPPVGKDFFVHQSSIHAPGWKSLKDGEELEFQLIIENGKYKAVSVTGPNGAFVQGNVEPYTPRQGGGRGRGREQKGVCFAFQSGNCGRGASCKFAHEVDSALPWPLGAQSSGEFGGRRSGFGGGAGGFGRNSGYGSPVYGRGGFPDMGYPGYNERPSFGYGGGRSTVGVCFDWQKAKCHRGDSCRFEHPPDEEGIMANGAAGGKEYYAAVE